MAARKKGRLGIRTGAKALEKKLIQKSDALAKDYSPLLPKGCEKYFTRENRILLNIQKYSEDKKALQRLSRKGDKLGRAYAGLLLLRLSETVPGIAVFRLPHGEASVSMTGETSKDKLIGVQHYDDPVLRLYSVNDMTKKKKVYVYSTGEGMYCSGREPSPPRDFMYYVLKDEGLPVVKKEGQSICQHMDRKWGPNLWIRFKSTGEGARLCPRCLNSDRNSAMLVLRRISGRRVEDDLEAGVDLGITWDDEDRGGYSPLPKKYLQGVMSDKSGYDYAYPMAKRQCISGNTLVAGGKGFSNRDELVDAVDGTEEEKIALSAALSGYEEGIIAPEATANSILSEIWHEQGMEALQAVLKDSKLARSLYTERRLEDVGPGQIIAEGLMVEKKRRTISGLPTYQNLGPLSSFADSASRVYRMDRTQGLVQYIKNTRLEDTRMKSLAYAFLMAVDEEGGMEWRYSGTEREFAEFLKDFALRLLDCHDEEHGDALGSLIQASGSSETLD